MKKKTNFRQFVPANVPIRRYGNKFKPLNYSEVKIYIPKDSEGHSLVGPGNYWYVYFYYRNPKTGKMDSDSKFQFKNDINRFKTIRERKAYGRVLCDAYTEMLNEGWNPWENEVNVNHINFDTEKIATIDALEQAYREKKQDWSESTISSNKSRITEYFKFCRENNFADLPAAQLRRKHVTEFLNEVQRNGASARTVNNYKSDIGSLFGQMVQNNHIHHNFVNDIKKLKSVPVKNAPFTKQQIADVKKFLQKENPYLLQYIRVMAYSFLRNREVLRLRVKDVDLQNRIFSVQTKTDALEKIYITDPVFRLLHKMELENKNPSDFLFSRNGGPGEWEANLKTKTKRFSDDFRAVKKKFRFGSEYTIYSFRHSFTVDLYENFISQGMNENEALLKMMPITRKKTIEALRLYLRDIKQQLPKNYSENITINL